MTELKKSIFLGYKNLVCKIFRYTSFSDFVRLKTPESSNGVIAYLKVNEKADMYVERKGLFVIKATGDSASITNKKTFQPKIF